MARYWVVSLRWFALEVSCPLMGVAGAGEALEILGDSMKRGLYDEGYDKAAIADRIERAHKAARESGRGHHHHHH